MAARYWVGGTASWDGTAGTKWALTSGGAGGQAVPTTADDVFFDAASGAVTCTIATGNTGAKSINCTGFTGTLAGTAAISVAGSVTLVAGQGFTYTGTPTLTATGTLTTGGKTLFELYINGTVTLGSALTVSSAIFVSTSGNLNTSASNFSITALSFTVSTSTSTLTLNGSTLTITGGGGFSATTTSTVNAGTSTIVLSGSGANFGGGDKTYNAVSFTSTTTTSRSISGANTFSTLSLTAPSAGVSAYVIVNNQTITTFICAGASAVRRVFLQTNILGTSRTLTVTTWSSITDVDFRDITMNSSRSGTRLGNCGGNTNITFSAAKTVYWNLAGTQNWSATGWATSSGGAPAVNNLPLAQDTAVFNNTGAAGTVTIDSGWQLGTMDMSTRTTSMTLSGSGAIIVYGNWLNGTGTTVSISSSIQFKGRTTQTITSNGRSFSCQVIGSGVNSNIALADALTCSDLFSVDSTTGLILSNNTLTASYFTNQSAGGRTLAFGTGNITVTGVSAFNIFSTSLTTTGTPVVNVTYSGASAVSISAGTLNETNAISFNFTAGTYSLTFLNNSSDTVKDVNFTGFAGTWSSFTSPIIYGSLTVSTGMTISGTTIPISFRATSGIKTITSNGKTFDFPINFNGVGGTWQLQDNLTQGSTRSFTLTNGTLDLNGKTYSASAFATATGTKNLTFNGGTLTLSAATTTAFNNAVPTGFTTTAGTGTGTIRMTGATAKTFVGAGSTYNCTLDQGGAGALTITGANTFNNITNTYAATGATSILFTAGTTNTFSNWNASGQATRLLTIGSVTAASHTLSKSTGTVSADYLSLSYSTATGGATWYAGANSTDGGNNTGWIFTGPPSGNFLTFFI